MPIESGRERAKDVPARAIPDEDSPGLCGNAQVDRRLELEPDPAGPLVPRTRLPAGCAADFLNGRLRVPPDHGQRPGRVAGGLIERVQTESAVQHIGQGTEYGHAVPVP